MTTRNAAGHRILIRSKDRILLVDPLRIDWIEACGNYVRFHVGESSHLVRGAISDWERRLQSLGFLRVHRSALVNLPRVVSLTPTFCGDYTLLLIGGAKVPLSRTHREAFFNALNEPAPRAARFDGRAGG